MATQEVYMDVPAVRNISKGIKTVSEVLTGVNKVLEVLSTTLKATAFIGLVGGAVVAQFIDMIRPQIEQMAKKTEEISKDVSDSVEAFARGDQQGSTRFY